MKQNKKGGFTLLEVVVCIVLISLLSLGFMQIVVANSSMTKRSMEYNQGTYDFGAAIDMGRERYTPKDKEVERTHKQTDVLHIQLGTTTNIETLEVKQYEVKYADSDMKRAGQLIYFGQ